MTVRFIPDGHRYLDDAGRDYLSVTTLLKDYFPFDALAIAARVSVDSRSRYFGMDPKAIAEEWDGRAEAGTFAHKAIETWSARGVWPASRTPEYMIIVGLVALRLRGSIRSETLTWNEELMLAGTVDIIRDRPGQPKTVYDIKTSRKLGPEKIEKFSLQLCFYCYMLTAQTGTVHEPGGIIWFENFMENRGVRPILLKPIDVDAKFQVIVENRLSQLK